MRRAILDRYLAELVQRGGSDLHLRVGSRPRVRVEGELLDLEGTDPVPADFTGDLAAEIMPPRLAERFRSGQESDFAYTLPGSPGGRFRVNAYLQRDTVSLVFRVVVTKPKTIAQLHLPHMVQRFADEPRGLVIVAGPTGAGKTTTLAAMVDHINRTRSCHIVTVEDPIEVIHEDERATISQRELGADTQSYSLAMRSVLRQDPDVILVGEMRDADTIAAAMAAAETGHLVLSTLHTTDASETINRIIEFFPPSEQRHVRLVLAGVLRGTVCQRLVRRADTAGRLAVTEILVVNGRVQSWILDPTKRQDVQEIIAQGEFYGMHTFDQSILEHFEAGRIDLSAAMSAASEPHNLSVEMRRRGVWPTDAPDPERHVDDDTLLAEVLRATEE